MSIYGHVGMGRLLYPSEIAPEPPPGGGPAFLFVVADGFWTALLASDETTWEGRESGGASETADSWADDEDVVTDVAIADVGTPETYLDESTDGGNNFTRTTGDMLGGVVIGRIVFRDGEFGLVIDEPDFDGTVGGLYTSTDGLSWTRVNLFPIEFEFGRWGQPQYWARTDSHLYFLTPDHSIINPAHSLQVDTAIGTPAVWSIQAQDGPVTGGTFQVQDLTGGAATSALAWDADDITVKAALEDRPPPGPPIAPFQDLTVSVSGDLHAGGMLITYPYPAPQVLTTLSSVTGGGAIVATEITPGTSGHKNYVATTHPLAMYGSFAGDVAIAVLRDTLTDELIVDKAVNTTITTITPGFFNPFDGLDYLRSPDGVRWVGVYTDGGTGESQLITSDDSGATWTLVGPSAEFGIVAVGFDPAVANRWWALLAFADSGFAKECTLYVSTDDGDTWTDFGADTIFAGLGDYMQIVPLGGKTD